MNDRGSAGLNPAVIAIHRGVAADPAIFEPDSVLLGHEQLDILAQRSLVAVQGEHIVGLLLHHLLGDLALASMVTIAPSMANMSSSLGMAMISLDFSATLIWPSTRRWWAAKAETMWIGA